MQANFSRRAPPHPLDWHTFYVFDATRAVPTMASTAPFVEHLQTDAGSPFRERRLVTRLSDGGRAVVLLKDRALARVTSAGTPPGAPVTDAGAGGEGAWRAALASEFGVVLAPAEAARLAVEMPLPPAPPTAARGAAGTAG